MVEGQRAEAARVLESALRERHDEGWIDLLTMLLAGDSRLAPAFVARMREAH